MTAQALEPRVRMNRLLDQQLWFIGHDIRHPDGNALLRYGFTRARSLSGDGTSCYRLAADDPWGRELVCWGFGLYFGAVATLAHTSRHVTLNDESVGVLLFRSAASGALIRSPLALPLHKPTELPTRATPRTDHERQLLDNAVCQVAAQLSRYERWVEVTLGPAHRARVMACLPRHKRRLFSVATHLDTLWGEVAQRFERHAGASAHSPLQDLTNSRILLGR